MLKSNVQHRSEAPRLMLANAAACELTGYSEEELLGMRIPDLHSYRTHHDSILNGQEALTEAEVLRKDGTKVVTEFNNRRIMFCGHTLIAHPCSGHHRTQTAGEGGAKGGNHARHPCP